MNRMPEKEGNRNRIPKRIRWKLSGSAERPRLAVFRSVAHIYAQVIDDAKGVTLASASTVDKAAKTNGGNVAAAKTIGKLGAERAKGKGIRRVAFDRGGDEDNARVKTPAAAPTRARRG